MDFGVGTLVNRDHAFIFSQDKLYIGGGLDDKGYAVGKATFIDNASATIEALGDGAINTHRLWNHDIHLKMGEVVSYEGFSLFRLPGSSESYREGVDGYMNWNNKNRHDNNAYFTFYDQSKGRVGSPNWHTEYFTRKTITPTIEHQDPAKIAFGGNLTLQGDDLENNASKFLIGKRLTLGDQIFESNKTNGDIGHAGGVQLRNKDAVANILKFDNGEAQEIAAERHHCGRHHCWGHYNHGKTAITNRPLPPIPHYFKMVDNTIGESISSTGSVGAYHKSGSVASIDINANLPTESLYQINPNANSHYLVETDPAFTDRNKWLSSDYMFKQLRNDPQNMLKRLGDGFYEQRLVNEQINQLTGRRFLENYSSDYDQYKALMDNGAYYAKKMNLVPGVALTSSQMKELTSDMVWMVKREVTLKDGSKKEVLVPQVYVVGRNTDIDSRGAVISANDVIMNIKGDVQNSGVISGRNLTGLAANNIENLGGRLQGRELYLVAKNMLNNLGGELNATDNLVAQGKHINIESTTSETENTPDFYQKSLTQQASVKVGNDNKKGSASFIATENITVKGANVDVNGNAVFSAGKALNFGTVETENKEHYVPNADNYYKLDQKQEVGSQLNVTGNLDTVGKSAVEMRGVSVTSNGTMNVLSDGNINIQEARYKEQLSSASKAKSRGLISSTTEVYRHKHNYDTAEASNLDADKINLHSNNGNITIQGSNVVGENGLTVRAKNIDIKEAENKVYSEDFHSKKKSGVLGGGGLGVTFGTQKQTLESDKTKFYAQGSQVGSLNGNTTLIAENHYSQTASQVSAVNGDVNILAKSVDIKAADDKYETNTKQKFEQKGVSLALTSPILSALQAVQGTVKSVERIGQSKNDRVNAMAAANSAMDAYRAGQAVGQAGKAMQEAMENGNMDSVVGVQVTYGQQKSESRTHTEGKTAAKSQVNAGGKVNIVATGAGKASNITIQGSDVSGKQGTFLEADNDINITAAEQTHKERSTNQSSGFNAGVAMKVSNGAATGITVGGNYGKGYGNGDETTYVASHVGDANSQTTLQAGGDANIIGSQVKGKRVEVNAQNLNIESLQDTATYKGKQMNGSGSVTVGYGASVGGSFNKSNIHADHASVNEQAGIYAGDEGYDINVNHTDLKGGLITSTQKAEDEGKNRFSTGTITHSDIENHSNYSGSSFGVSGSVAANFDTPFGKEGQAQSGKQAVDEDGNPIYRNDRGELTTEAKNAQGKDNAKQLATGWDSLETTHSVGFGYDKDSQSSTTKSGINTKNIEIRDQAGQLAKTGETVEQTLDSIRTDVTTDNAEQHSGKLENHFDKDEVQREIDLQRNVTQEFDRTRQDIKKELYNIADKKRAEAVEIRRNTRGEDGKTGYNTEESLELDRRADGLEKTAFYVDLALGSLYGWGNADATKYVGTAVASDPIVRTATAPKQIWLEKCKQDSLYCSNFNRDGSKRPTENGRAEIGDKRQIFDISELKPSDSNNVITISNNGIMNPLDDALKNAIKQNKWATNKEGVAVVYNRPTSNPLSELLYAAYDKTNDLLGGRLPLTTAEKANVELYQYAKDNKYQIDLSNHSRGGLTASVALQYANRNGLTNIPIRESRFYGTATNVQDYANQLAHVNGSYRYLDKNNQEKTSNGTVKSAVHHTDFVGRTPLMGLRSKYIVGGNEPTGGVENTWFTYSHSSYFAEVPNKDLTNEKREYIDDKGYTVKEKNRVANEYRKEFEEKWQPTKNNLNPSLPKIVTPE